MNSFPIEKDWFKDWFASEDYLKVYNHRDSKDAQNLSQLIINTTNPKPDDFILDSACGTGRHGIYLASKGFKVIGFDLSRTLLLKANEEAARMSIHLNLVQADIREIFFKKKFFCALNLFTSFGYFDTDEENFIFIKHSKEFLKEGGFYVLDYFNKNYLERNLIPASEKIVENTLITENRLIENGRVKKKIRLIKGDEPEEFYESVKLYDWKFITDRFSKIGFKIYRMFGDYHGSDFNEVKSPRLIIVFQL